MCGIGSVSYTHLDVYKRQLLGLILMYFCVGYFRTESENTLLTNVRSLRDNFSTVSMEDAGQMKEHPYVEQAVRVVANATGSIFFVTDNYGKILYCSDNSGAVDTSRAVSSKILNRAFSDGEDAELGELSGIYSHSYYTCLLYTSRCV